MRRALRPLLLALFAAAVSGFAPSQAGAQAISTATWTRCGGEAATCTVPGIGTVRFGANGIDAPPTVSGQFVRTTALFEDPVPGTPKGSDMLSDVESAIWQVRASEGRTCALPGARVVRSGAGDNGYQRSVSTAFTCSAGLFSKLERDRPEVLGRDMASFDPRIVRASGDGAAVDEAIAGLGVVAQRSELPGGRIGYTRTASVALIDGDGVIVDRVGAGLEPDELAKRLGRLAGSTTVPAVSAR